MSVINILSPHVADMIAAGEVVERPASVIKELVENSFDAGAKNITVELRSGGVPFIRVTDDGCGMSPEDAGIAFLRHATSKLRDETGLEAIETMGFRGEALAAISAVSHVELRTRRRGDESGTFVSLAAGEIQEMEPAGCPEGTSLTVRDLFYNTPARLKFLKSDRAEASACVQTALRCALGRPEISVRLLRDGKEEFFSPGDGRQDSCVYTLLGRELAATLLPCRAAEGGMRVSGFVSSPSAGRGSRAAQYFFCNGRSIRSLMLQAAVEQAYKNTLLSGRYPACVLYLELGCGSVDVNVHPAKTEVKFSFEKQVFDLVYSAVRLALEQEDRTAEVLPSASTRRLFAQQGERGESPERFSARDQAEKSPPPPPPRASARTVPYPSAPFEQTPFPGVLRSPSFAEQTRLDLSAPSAPVPAPAKAAETSPVFTSAPAEAVENPVQTVESAQIPPYRVLGEAMKTYLLVESEERLILIDKHAAHERMNFDHLKAADRSIPAQTLLVPQPLHASPEDAELLEKHAPLLEELGFEIEAIGEEDFVIRAVPADIDGGDALASVEEILEKLRSGKAPDAQSARDEILHTVACKAAIKAGWDTGEAELARIAEAVLSGAVKYCPHGRPVSVLLTRRELDKLFKRIV